MTTRSGPVELGNAPERICVDHGLTGTRWDRPGLREAVAAFRAGDVQVVTEPDRLAWVPTRRRSQPRGEYCCADITGQPDQLVGGQRGSTLRRRAWAQG